MNRTPTDNNDTTSNESEAPGAAQGGGAGSAASGVSVEQLMRERDSLYERLARAQAEFQNSRRRLETEMDTRLQYANQGLIKSLLPVLDNFERALSVDPGKTDVASILKGMQIVHNQWVTVLKNQSVLEIAPEPGTLFDATRHEAIMQQPNDKYTEPTVTQLLQKGYSLHERTLRPAQVAVSRTS
jgi:molecular chaperone GrpE